MLDFGILGKNARNLQYIKKFNPKKAIRLADNKLLTKRVLSERGIPVPETYATITNRDQLYEFDFSQLGAEEFIVKPNQGSRGRGIYRVRLADKGPNFHRIPKLNRFELLFTKASPYDDQWYYLGEQLVDDMTFRRYLVDILSGKNSMTAFHDTVIIEEMLRAGSGFEQFCEHGLADIRVIVFNLIPVAAMLRVPTKESDGKANLDRGALSVGIEVGTGKTTGLYRDKKIYTGAFPKPYESFAHQHLAYRDDILLFSSEIQYFANLGFLALDRVITDDGPKLLEINARAGLKFQLSSVLPLKKRLEKVADVKVTTPEKGVEIAQSLFSLQKTQVVTMSKVLYLSQHGRFHISSDEKKIGSDVIVEVDPKKKRNYVSKHLYQKLQRLTNAKSRISLTDQSVKFTDLDWKPLESNEKNKVILGKEALSDYYLKPIDKITHSLKLIKPQHIEKAEIDQLHILDQKLSTLGKILNTSRILKPVNFLEEFDTFLMRNGRYDPTFAYRWPSDEKLQEVKERLSRLYDKYFGRSKLQSDFAQLFREKIGELQYKLSLLQAYKSQDTELIAQANIALYGEMQDDLLREAKEITLTEESGDRSLLGKRLTQWEIRKMIIDYLQERGLNQVRVKFDANTFGRMSITRGKSIVIRISHQSGFRKKELLATLAHEVDVHIMRYLSGLKSGWQILKSGTAGYIADEEGLAVYKSLQHIPEEYQKIGMYQKYYLMSIAGEKSFSELVGVIRSLTNKSELGAFKGALRLKKGLIDSSIKEHGAMFMKDKIYLDGYARVRQWIEAGGDVDQLMIGKIKIADLQYML